MAAVARPMFADLFRWLALKWNGMEGERREEEEEVVWPADGQTK